MSALPRIAILHGGSDGPVPLAFPKNSVDVVLDSVMGPEALSALFPLAPDVVVLDLRGAASTTSASITQVRSAWSSARIVVVGAAGDQQMAEAAFAAGTSGYVSRDAGPDSLLKAVLGAVRGKVNLGKTATLAILRMAGAAGGTPKSKPG